MVATATNRKNKRTQSGTQIKAVRNQNTRPKPPKAKPRRNRKRHTGIVEQVISAMHPDNRIATIVGTFFGGWIPFATYWVSHGIKPNAILTDPMTYATIGGLAYSFTTVYEWGKMAFASRLKAGGFVILTECIMVLGRTPWLSIVALIYLMCINAIASGCIIGVPKKQGD